MTEEHFSLREMEKKKREHSGDSSQGSVLQRKRGYISDRAFDDEETINVRSYFDIILYRKWVVVLITLAIMLSALYRSFSKEIFYQAKAQVLYKEEDVSMVSSITDEMGIRPSRAPSIETLAAISKTTPVLKKLRDKLPFKISPGKLNGMINVAPDIETDILHITATAPESDMAIAVANTFVGVFIEYQMDIVRKEASQAYDVIKEQIEKTKIELNAIEIKIKNFNEKEGVILINDEIRAKLNQIVNLDTSFGRVDSDIKSQVVEIVEIKEKLKMEAMTVVKETHVSKPLHNKLVTLELELATALTHRTENHPEVVSLNNSIASIRNLIKKGLEQSVETETFGINPTRSELLVRLANSELDIEGLSARREALLKAKEEASNNIRTYPKKVLALARLERQKIALDDVFLELQRKYQASRIAKEIHVGSLHRLQPAEMAVRIQENLTQSGILGLFVGLTMGIGLVLFLEYLDNTFKTPHRVREIFGLNTIGIIPIISLNERIIDINKTRAVITEIFRMVHNNLRYTSHVHNNNVIMFASAQREEGTTTCTINAGISAVMQGKSAVVIDCDLRRARLSRHFGISRGRGNQNKQYSLDEAKTDKVFSAGLSDYLADEAELKDILLKTDIPKLFFIPAGTRVPNTAELLGSKKMTTLLKTIEKQVDVVYVDTPAVLPLVDATVVAPLVDSIIFIVEYRGVTVEDARMALGRVVQANPNVVGCIVNKTKWGKVHYYYYDDDRDEKEEFLLKERRSWYGAFKRKFISTQKYR